MSLVRNPDEVALDSKLAEATASQYHPAQRLLLAGGVSLVLVGLLSGGIFALFVSHVVNAELRSVWAALIESVARGDTSAIHPAVDRLRELAVDRGRAMSMHSHIASYGLLTAMIGLARHSLLGNSNQNFIASLLVLTGGALQGASMYAQSWRMAQAFTASDLGAVLLFIGISLTVFRLLRSDAAAAQTAPSVAGNFIVDNVLLRAGASLVCIGLVLGLYVAWRHIYFEQPALSAAFAEMLRALDMGDVRTASARFGDYKTIQTRIDITAASHSHAVFFGFVLLVTAFTIRSLRLPRPVLNAARVLVLGGAFLLPVCVFLAPRISMRFALGANIGGALVVLALAIVLIGLVVGKERTKPEAGRVMPQVSRPLVLGTLVALQLGLAASVLWSHLGAESPRLSRREDVADVIAEVAAPGERAEAPRTHTEANLAHSRMIAAHAHFLNLAVLLIALALLIAKGRLGPQAKARAAAGLAFGVIAYPAGLILDGAGVSTPGHVLAFAGSVVVVAISLAALWNVLEET